MINNIFAQLRPAGSTEEIIELLVRPGLVIERIVSLGQSSPPDFWYDQQLAEPVVVVQGEALLRFADEATPRRLKAGDFLLLVAGF